MPMLNILVSGAANAALSAEIAGVLGDLTASRLGKDPSVTAIAINYTPPEHWFSGGKSLSGQKKSAFWLDIKITDATNTKAEMAAYIASVFSAMERILGNLHEESYVLVHPVPASAYGYGGKTQEYRYVAGQTKPLQQAA